VAIGCDEISYRPGQRYLTRVADHASGAIIWAQPGRNAATLAAFFDELGDRKQSIRAVSIDMNAGYENAIQAAVPDAEVCFDPFQVAVNQVRRADWNAHAESTTATGDWLKGVRWALLKTPEHLTTRQQTKLAEVQAANRGLYRAYLLKEELRALYHLPDRSLAAEHLAAWLAWASRSKLKPFCPAPPYDPPLPRRHPRRDPPRTLQRPASKDSTARSASSATAASASTAPTP
jgi:transposase